MFNLAKFLARPQRQYQHTCRFIEQPKLFTRYGYDTPTASAALLLVIPEAICCQNCRSTSGRCDGAACDVSHPVRSIFESNLPVCKWRTSGVAEKPWPGGQYEPQRQLLGYSVIERFLLNLKMQRVWERDCADYGEAIHEVANYIVKFYNSVLLHSKLGYLSPTAFVHKSASQPAY